MLQAYRKKALVLHPDKRKESEREKAQEEFDQLQKAYDILCDPEARAALENLANARRARKDQNDQQDAKRRKMREGACASCSLRQPFIPSPPVVRLDALCEYILCTRAITL